MFRNRSDGFSLIEVLVVLSVLAIGLLTHASSGLASANLLRAEGRHGAAIQTLRRFKARLRSDTEWDGLYQMLNHQMGAAPGSFSPLTEFFPDFDAPDELGDVSVLVEVPRDASVADGAVLVLREDVVSPRFGLPSDLNGDGLIDDAPRDHDYHALPVVITFKWAGPGDAPQRIQVTTWLRGERQ